MKNMKMNRMNGMAAALALAFALLAACEQPAGTVPADTLERPAPGLPQARLASLSASAGTLDPAFDPAVTAYTVIVAQSTETITITAQTAGGATVSNPAASGIALEPGDNPVEITAAGEGLASTTYTVTVARLDANEKLIYSQTDFEKIGKVGSGWSLSGTYRLASDISLANWTPCGTDVKPFTGTFNGNGKTITVQSFNNDAARNTRYVGVFGYIKSLTGGQALVKNLQIQANVTLNGGTTSRATGMAAGCAEGARLENISASGSFSITTDKVVYLSGVAGWVKGGTVTGCVNSANLFLDGGAGTGLVGVATDFNSVGGVAGMFSGGAEIANCRNTGEIILDCPTAAAQGYAGGIAGTALPGSLAGQPDGSAGVNTGVSGWIQDCDNTGNVYSRARGYWAYAGGITAYISGAGSGWPAWEGRTRVVRCHSGGIISTRGKDGGDAYGPFPYLGGIVAYNYYGALTAECVFDGTIVGSSRDYAAGLIVGYNSQDSVKSAQTLDCYSTTEGPLVGYSTVYGNLVARCYGFGGPILAKNGSGTITGCVLFSTPGGSIVGSLAGSGTEANCHVRGTDSKPDQAFYEGLSYGGNEYVSSVPGWDFSSVWRMGSDGCPRLRWETP
jgi:hypothetical protein